jgi:uncharacterized protein YajQ (UPF0234 family)
MNTENNIKLYIIGKVDCLRFAATQFIIEDNIKNNNIKIHSQYEMYFETQFDIFIQKLLKDNVDANLAKSPIIYSIVY